MIWNFFIQLAISAVFFVVGELLRPKPDYEDAEAIPFTEARIPQIDPQRKQAVIWGKVRITSPHLMDITEYNPLAIKTKIKTGMFSSEKVTIGHRYFVGMQLGFCKGVADIRKLYYDDELLWDRASDPFTDQGDDGLFFDVDEPEFLGGAENGGGIIGRFRWFPGSTTQNRATYLLPFQTPTPAYRWTTYLLLENVEVGENPNIDGFSIEVDRYPDPLSLGGDNQVDDGATADIDLNPMSIVAELFTDDDFGFNLPSDINAGIMSAVATVLHTEKNGMSLKWTNNQSIDRLVDTVNRQVEGLLRFNPKTGLWEYKLVRDDFVVMNLLTLDESNSNLEKFGRANWDETVNEIQINFQTRDSTERVSAATAQDTSNFRRQQRHKVLALSFSGLYSEDTANNIASRELRTNGFTLSSATLVANREAWDLLPGDPFILANAELGITQLIMRVGGMGFGDQDQTEIELTALEDIFKLADNIFTPPPGSLYGFLNIAPVDIAVELIQDQPYFFNFNDALTLNPGTTHKTLTLAGTPQSNSLNYRVNARQGTDPYVGEVIANYNPTGVLNALLLETTSDTVTSIQVDSVSLAVALEEASVSDNEIQQQGVNLALIVHATGVNEWVAYESLTVVGSVVTMNNVHRGMFDTLALEHPATARVWFVTNLGLEGPGTGVSEYGSVDVVDTKLTNITTVGEVLVSVATELPLTFRNRINRPYIAGNFKVEGVRYPAAPQPLDADIEFTWRGRDRLVPDLRYQDDNTEEFEAGFEYFLQIFNEDTSTLLRTVRPSGSNNTPAGDDTLTTANSYDYTNAKQVTDGGAFSNLRVELQIQESVTGAAVLVSLVDVIRIFNVTIPVNFNRRGPIYHSIAATTPSVIYPMTGDLPIEGEIDPATVDSVTRGVSVGANAPGPTPIITSVTLPGSDADAADWLGNLELPDGVLNSFDHHVGYFHLFHFKIVKDAQTNRRYIITKDNAANIDNFHGWRTLINSSGEFEEQVREYDIVQEDSLDIDFEDGRWHQAVLYSWRVASNSQRRQLMIDGIIICKDSPGFAPDTSTTDASIGGPDNAESSSYGWAKMFFAQLASALPYEPKSEGGADDEFIMKAQIDGMQRSPFEMQAVGMFKHAWIRGGHGEASTFTMGTPDFSGNATDMDSTYAPDNVKRVNDGIQVGFTKSGAPTALDGVTAGPVVDAWSYKTDMRDGANRAYLRLPTDYWNGTPVGTATLTHQQTPDSIWPKLFANHNILIADNFTNPIPLFSVAAFRVHFTETDQPHSFEIWIETDGRIKIGVRRDNTDRRIHRTDNVCCVTGVPLHISVFNVLTTGWEVWVNGIEYTVDNAFDTNGTVPAIDDWMNARPTGTLTSSMRASVYFWGDAIPPTASATGELEGFHAEWGAVKDETWSGDDHVLLYAASFKGFPSMKDILMDFNPYNVYQVLANTAEDLRGVMGTVTATGAFTTDEEVPIPAWDLTKPLRFQDSVPNRLEYTVHFLDGKGTGLIDDFSLVCIGQIVRDTIAQTFFTNYNGSSETNFALNYSNTNDRLEFQTTGGTAILGELDVTGGDAFCAVLTHEDDGGTDRWNWWQGKDCGQPAAEVTTANAYTGGAITDGRIGDDDGLVAPLDGMTHYISAFDRTITPEHSRRICLAYRGFTGALLEIHKHIDDTEANAQPGFMFPLDERDITVTQAENWVINDPLIQNMTINGSGITQERGAVSCGHGRFPAFASGTFIEGPGTNFAAAYPLTMGVVVRVDSGTDAMVSLANGAVLDQHIALGIVDGNAAIRFDDAGATGTQQEEVGTTSITPGEFAIVSVTIESATVRRLYLNGKLEATFTTSFSITTMIGNIDTVAVNRISGLGTDFDGSYQMYWGVQADLSTEEHQVIHANHMPFAWEAITFVDTPEAQWLLNEPTAMIADFFRDQYNDDYGAVPTSTGVTQGAEGIVPGRRDLCCDFDGANGGIDTNWSSYETGTNNRAFECWLEAGFEGTVVSMGANVDAQAVVISVDSSGDVSIHIRGGSNERIWTTALDAGTEHHLLVMLDGDSLHDFQVWIDGIEETTVSTAGTDTTLGTVATLDFFIAEDVTDIGKADGNGKMYGVTAYNLGASGVITDDNMKLRYDAGVAIYSGHSF